MADSVHLRVVKAGPKAIVEALKNAPHIRFNLRGANLSGANLSRTDLSRTDLSRTDLVRADVRRADLIGANLTSANLEGANLESANLESANLSSCRFHSTSIANTNFTNATGLESCDHVGPSSIGIDTLERNAGLPEIFLRGCGVPDHWIEYIPSLVGNPIDFYSCFISYSHEDKQFTRQLHDRLQGQGIRCWLDEHQLKPGDDMHAKVDRGIRIWDKVLLCCSEDSLSSWWVDKEVTTAMKKEEAFHKTGKSDLAIIPLMLDKSFLSWEGKHAAVLQGRLAADFTNWKRNADKFDQQFEQVLKALRTDGGRPEPVPKLGT